MANACDVTTISNNVWDSHSRLSVKTVLACFAKRACALHNPCGSSGKLCHRLCASVVCSADERLVPCRLPHQARCEALFPAILSVPAEMHVNTFYAGAEVNLLNDAKQSGNIEGSTYDHRVASFENIVMVLQSALEYQCVWNADRIIDNTATPAGISHALWVWPGKHQTSFTENEGLARVACGTCLTK